MKIYLGARHEVLNDFSKQEAYNDIEQFVNTNIN